MVASSSNLLLVASTHAGHVRTGSTIPNDHDLTTSGTENRSFLIASSGINSISGTNLKDIIMLETVAPIAFASTSTASTTPSSSPPTTTTTKKSSIGEKQRPRPRRKKMVSIGVNAMNKMMVTSSSVVVAVPESPTILPCEREQRNDMEDINIRSTKNRKVLSFSLSTPTMPDMMPALPTPSMNRSSKLKNEMSNNAAPMSKKKKNRHHHLHMGRRLRQIKKRLFLELTSSNSKSSSASKSKREEYGRSGSERTSATTSTSSFGTQEKEEEEDDALPIIDDMMTVTTSLKPRVISMFQEEEEDMMMPMMPMMPPAAPWSQNPCPSISSTTDDVVNTTPSSSISTSLNKALSVLSPTDTTAQDDNDDGDAVADDTDDWGIFASFNDDDDDDEDDDIDHKHNYNYNFKSKSSLRSSFTKSNTNPCFQPRSHLPAAFAATIGAE